MTALWRQQSSLHPTFQRIHRCLHADWFLLPYELDLQRAHAGALVAANLLSEDEGTAIESALEGIERDHAHGIAPNDDAEDIHTWLETELTRRAGVAGKKIHTARSRNDQVATLLKMYLIGSGKRLATQLHDLVQLACRQGDAWADIPMPLHTHQQFAAPGNAGFWLLRYAVSWSRVHRHLTFLLGDWQWTCPLGSGAVAGSSLPINRQLQASGLGFDGPSLNALESTTCRDECIEFGNLAAQLALHLQSFAADAILFSQTQLGWLKYPAEFATGSSMMPNKSNPDAMELLRGECNAILAAQSHLALLLKGLPSGYNRDLQCIKPVVRDVAESLLGLCEMTREFVAQMQFDSARTTDAMRHGAIGATLAMEAKVRDGMALREAHHATAADIADGRIDHAAAPADWIAAYQTAGSAGPTQTRAAAKQIIERLRA